MEEDLEAAILAGANDDDIEYIIMDHILINRDGNDDVWRHQNFNINQMTDEDVVLNFRFEREHLPILKECLGLPDVLLTEEGHNVEGRYTYLGF